MLQTPVLIAGGGPVGLNLAIALAFYDVPCMIVNDETSTRTQPAGSAQNARTMEHYRRLGISRLVRDQGLPDGHSTDAVFITRVNGYELSRVNLPPVDRHPNRNSPETELTPEPMHRANQLYVEAALRGHLESLPQIDVRYGWRLNSFSDGGGQVTAEIEEISSGRIESVSCAYLVGCDGANSIVRRSLGVEYSGESRADVDFMMGRMLAIYYNAPGLYDVMPYAEPWQQQSMNLGGRASIVALNGRGDFLTHAKLNADEDPAQLDVRKFIHGIIGEEIPIRVLATKPWTAGLSLLADSYQKGRVLMAGDTVHLFTPTGGFGMNTGVDDAANLAWKLAAAHHGFAGDNLIASYETERRPIGKRNLAQSFAFATAKSHLIVPPNIEDDTPAGDAARAELGQEMKEVMTEEFIAIGIQLGARYDGSPLIISDGSAPPKDDPFVYIPSAIPGGRAPHAWLADDTPLFDHYGKWFTLLSFGSDGVAFEAAAAELNVPLTLLTLTRWRNCSGLALVLPSIGHSI